MSSLDFGGTFNYNHISKLYVCKPTGGFFKDGSNPLSPVDTTCTDGHKFQWTAEEKLVLKNMAQRKEGVVPVEKAVTNVYDKTIAELQSIHMGRGITPYYLLQQQAIEEFQKFVSAFNQEVVNKIKFDITAGINSLASIFCYVNNYINVGDAKNLSDALCIIPSMNEYLDASVVLLEASNKEGPKSCIHLQHLLNTLKYALENRHSAFVQLITPNKCGRKEPSYGQKKFDHYQSLLAGMQFTTEVLSTVLSKCRFDFRENEDFKQLSVAMQNSLLSEIELLKKTFRSIHRDATNGLSDFARAQKQLHSNNFLSKVHLVLIEDGMLFDNYEEKERAANEIVAVHKSLHTAYVEFFSPFKVNCTSYELLIEEVLKKFKGLPESKSIENLLNAVLNPFSDCFCIIKSLVRVYPPKLNNFTALDINSCKTNSHRARAGIGFLTSALPNLGKAPFHSSWISPIDHVSASIMRLVEFLEASPCINEEGRKSLYLIAQLCLVYLHNSKKMEESYLKTELEELFGKIKIERRESIEDFKSALTRFVELKKLKDVFMNIPKRIEVDSDSGFSVDDYWDFFSRSQIDKNQNLSIDSLSEEERTFIYKTFNRMAYFISKMVEDAKDYQSALKRAKESFNHLFTAYDTSPNLYVRDKPLPISHFNEIFDNSVEEIKVFSLTLKMIERKVGKWSNEYSTNTTLLKDIEMWSEIINKQKSWLKGLMDDDSAKLISVLSHLSMTKPANEEAQALYEQASGDGHILTKKIEDILCPIESIFPLFERPLKRLYDHHALISYDPPPSRKRKPKKKRLSPPREVSPPKSVSSSSLCTSISSPNKVDSVPVNFEVLVPVKVEVASHQLREVIDLVSLRDQPDYLKTYAEDIFYNLEAYLGIIDEVLNEPSSAAYATHQELFNKTGLVLENALKLLITCIPYKGEKADHPLWNIEEGHMKSSHDLLRLLELAQKMLLQSQSTSIEISKSERKILSTFNHVVSRYSRYPMNSPFNRVSAALVQCYDVQQKSHLIEAGDDEVIANECRQKAKDALLIARKLINTLVTDKKYPQVLVNSVPTLRGARSEDCIAMQKIGSGTDLDQLIIDHDEISTLIKKRYPKKTDLFRYLCTFDVSLQTIGKLVKMPREEFRKHTLGNVDNVILQTALMAEQLLLSTITLLPIMSEKPPQLPILNDAVVTFKGHERLLKHSHLLTEFSNILEKFLKNESGEALKEHFETLSILEKFLLDINHYPANDKAHPLAVALESLRHLKAYQQLIAVSQGFYSPEERSTLKSCLGNDESLWEQQIIKKIDHIIDATIMPLCNDAFKFCGQLFSIQKEQLSFDTSV